MFSEDELVMETWVQISYTAYFNFFIGNSQVKYKFLHMLQQETCGSQVRALPQGFRGCWFDPSQVSVIWVNGGVCVKARLKKGDTSTVSPWSFQHRDQQRLCFCPDWKIKIKLHKTFSSPSLPHLLRLPSFVFQRRFPSKRKW